MIRSLNLAFQAFASVKAGNYKMIWVGNYLENLHPNMYIYMKFVMKAWHV